MTDTAVAGWDRLVTRRNVTLTALMEALGDALADDPSLVPEHVIDAAKAIDRERRSRR